MTGLGERARLLDERTGLSTFIADACAVIECEKLFGIVLVSHSFGGLVISGVAERMAGCRKRVNRLLLGAAALAGTTLPMTASASAQRCASTTSAITRWTSYPTAISPLGSAPPR